MSGYNLKDEKEVALFLKNIGIEYRFSCYHEKRPDGCQLLGDYFEGVHKDFKRALTVYKLNCDEYNHAKSCYKYAAYRHIGRGSTRDDAAALQYFLKGCQSHHPESCLLSGAMLLENNTKDPNNYHTAVKYFHKGCLGNNMAACHHASGLYMMDDAPKGFEKDMKKAFEYATRACDLGHAHSCANLSMMYQRGEGTQKDEELANKMKRKALDIQDQYLKSSQEIKFNELG